MRLLRFGVVLMFLFAVGCGAQLEQSEFFQHDSMYKTWDHAKFSMGGHKYPTADAVEKSEDQGWWGIPIEVVPEK